MSPEQEANEDGCKQLAWQPGCTVSLYENNILCKLGAKVRPCEEAAMRFVAFHCPEIPMPKIFHTNYRRRNDNSVCFGEIIMSYIPGKTLKYAWADFDDEIKARICQDIWDIVAKLREIPRPDHLAPDCFYCTADGSPSHDPLLDRLEDQPYPRFTDDDTFRSHIYQRYVANAGLTYRDGTTVQDLLPHSNRAVFCHGDISPRNIIVDEQGHIQGLLDWENAGWWPDYWEFAQMQKHCHELEHDWQHWMDRSKPRPWGITGIRKAWRVLF